MRQTASVISTYAADVSGVCSALYELGGMTVMHDASGCNSTYNTHDEPRWYDIDSMVYISGISEIDAIMGDDNKLIYDIISAAKELSPKFIAIAGTPIPMMIGTDFEAIASIIESETNIPTFGFKTNGMHSYISGVSMALEALAKRFVEKNIKKYEENYVNILGLTPLDFSINNSVQSIENLLEENNFKVLSNWAMNSTLEDIKKAGSAKVNLVVSYSGLATARFLYEEFNIPYVVGMPTGKEFSKVIINDLKEAIETKKNKISYLNRKTSNKPDITIIGESVISGSLAAAISQKYNKTVQILCPLESEENLLAEGDAIAMDEDDLIPYLEKSNTIVADPLYKPIVPSNINFVPLPHEGFSGRIYRREIPNLVNDI